MGGTSGSSMYTPAVGPFSPADLVQIAGYSLAPIHTRRRGFGNMPFLPLAAAGDILAGKQSQYLRQQQQQDVLNQQAAAIAKTYPGPMGQRMAEGIKAGLGDRALGAVLENALQSDPAEMANRAARAKAIYRLAGLDLTDEQAYALSAMSPKDQANYAARLRQEQVMDWYRQQQLNLGQGRLSESQRYHDILAGAAQQRIGLEGERVGMEGQRLGAAAERQTTRMNPEFTAWRQAVNQGYRAYSDQMLYAGKQKDTLPFNQWISSPEGVAFQQAQGFSGRPSMSAGGPAAGTVALEDRAKQDATAKIAEIRKLGKAQGNSDAEIQAVVEQIKAQYQTLTGKALE